MIENRDLTMDDYLAMLRRRLKVILIPTLLAPLAGFLISYAFPPKYTSQSLVLVEAQKVPDGYVKSVVTEDITQRIATMQQQVLSRNRLKPMIQNLQLKSSKSLDDMIDDIRANLTIEPVQPDITASTKKKPGQGTDLPGFYVNYTADNPHDAQQICSQLTSMMLEENLKIREGVAQGTTEFLSAQLDSAKKNLDDLDAKMAVFKKQYMGQLPGDEENNLKLLMGLNSQLDANTQTLNRAQQDKTYTESLLAQQVAAWKSSQNSTNPQTLQQQLAALQSQLITLQARYTDDYPDVVKAKADIAEVKRKLDEMNNAASSQADKDTSDKAGVAEPPEIRQLRLQVHQYDTAIAQATREQNRIKEQISLYQGRVALSPAIEEQYKALNRDYDTAQKFYNDLLAKKSESEMQTDMERRQQGEQMRLLNPASMPDSPSFPVRWMFAAGGAGGGLAIGLGLALWLELRDKAIRTEGDVVAILELPTLVAVPWIGTETVNGRNGKRIPEEKSEKVEV
ncbi:MAG TPA: Wzz/FepE/Etk N-terminal domain-containing protein [Terriglobales bacterium]|nr:Wzz/FepE/Etk N-terminal domain-containing protein [Terriglobales bacterium]